MGSNDDISEGRIRESDGADTTRELAGMSRRRLIRAAIASAPVVLTLTLRPRNALAQGSAGGSETAGS